ncbi:glycerate kinase [Microbacterium sp. zg.B48]|uniref:glycerate kinase n=1 Tax=Microbacterium sp. zg.B48 TaxID=2969408 RepID=UPI00214C3D73|nr:glycerate kinase [Microbacterium sp. zg.B48]MCR2763097.1 glycerate kinase [Microbacterium sp. zg.B48]
MIVVFAPDSFKGTIGAADAAAALAEGWHSVRRQDEAVLRPMADGGEGTLDAFAAAVPGARRVPVRVRGPADLEVDAAWLRLPPTARAPAGTAVVELGATSGIELLENLRPMGAHTAGLGQAIAAALAAGVSRVVVGLGSSASTDGGTGMLRALGARFLDARGADVPAGGQGLGAIAAADLSGLAAVPPAGVIGLVDVVNPLLGARGAAAVFGPQKGADPEQIAQLDGGLAQLARLLPADPGTPGAGAAGGAGFGLLAWGGSLASGAATVAELIGLPGAMRAASVIVTGEGAFDGQSASGKVPAHVAAAASGARVALAAGRIQSGADTSAFAAVISLTALAGTPASAMADPARWLREAGRHLARDLG